MFKRLFGFEILVFILILFISGCQPEPQVQRAFYHWQTNLSLSPAEQKSLQKLQISRLYAKFFDVDWDETQGQIVPLASIQIDTAGLEKLELVPVIYITNRSWNHVESEAQVETLAQKIVAKIDALAQPLDKPNLSEIQIDCDWTASSRRVYFAFLEKLGKKLAQRKCLLSTTIRLHQYKYPQRTGIPPVASGTLMLYNVGDLESWEEENSIFSQSAVEAYVPFPKYPLPLDVVLPAFSWGVLFREGEMIRLLNELRVEDLQGDTRFEQIAPQRFRVRKSTYLNGHYLYRGDLLRIETCGYAELLAAARFARKHLSRGGLRWVGIYHWHDRLNKALKYDELEDIFAVF
ncbi:MAG: hypothetical protein SFV55_11775 [Haliscomenobacter sp.]|uniref:hypothetical protein n=1 Tax=Haliscomenobacter sp. TaxID=2717303 RepID=UPI0029A176EA|nr:hypothetical protein [Haliscomenobacter sp.]MDX2069095.1 hypothetical protein [Haliscomenobacter sp.]